MKLLNLLFHKKKTVALEFCVTNLDRHLTDEAQSELAQLDSQGKISIREFECLSHCAKCKKTFYTIADGDFIAGTPDEVIEKVKSKLTDPNN